MPESALVVDFDRFDIFLQVLRLDGTVVKVIGQGDGYQRMELDQPTDVAVGHGKIVVADSGNNRVRVRNASNPFVMPNEKVMCHSLQINEKHTHISCFILHIYQQSKLRLHV